MAGRARKGDVGCRNKCRSNEKSVAKEGRQNWDGKLWPRVMLRCRSEKSRRIVRLSSAAAKTVDRCAQALRRFFGLDLVQHRPQEASVVTCGTDYRRSGDYQLPNPTYPGSKQGHVVDNTTPPRALSRIFSE